MNIKPVTDTEFDTWSDAVSVGFLNYDKRGQGDFRRLMWEKEIAQERVLGAFDGNQVVGTYGAFHTDLTVPGGAPLGVGAVTAVTVQATHRRRGILKGLMALGLRQSLENGEAASVLIPSEWPIYGRYGYGPATEEARVEIDAAAADLRAPLPGTVELIGAEQWAEQMPAVYDRIRAASPGAIERSPRRWQVDAGLFRRTDRPEDKGTMFAVLRDESGLVRGGASYQARRAERAGFRPNSTLSASVLAQTPAARARLLQFLWEQDWVVGVDVETEPCDAAWRLFLRDPRAARQTDRYDTLWVRILDVAAALSARTYQSEGRIVLAVEDEGGPAGGVWALEGGPAGATVERTTQSPDLTLPVQSLGSMFLGGHAPSLLASADLVTQERHGALALADRMFKTPTQPFAPTWF